MPPVGSLGARIAAGSSKMLGARIGIGVGRGSLSAARTRARPNCDALNRSAASGRPARSSTAASGPRSAETGINLPISRRQRGDRGVTIERNPSSHRLDEDQGQRVDVGVPVERLALGLLRRGVAGDVGGDPRRLRPVGLAEDAGESEVDDAQPAVVAEDQLRRGQLGVHEALAVGEVESPAGLQPDHQRLRRGEVTAAVEEVAQVAAGQVFDDDVDRVALADLLLTPVVDGSEVGMRDRRHLVHLLAERAPEPLRLGELGADQLDRHRAIEFGVVGVGDQRVGAGGDGAQHPVAPPDRATVESPAPGRGGRLVSWSVVAHVLTDRQRTS